MKLLITKSEALEEILAMRAEEILELNVADGSILTARLCSDDTLELSIETDRGTFEYGQYEFLDDMELSHAIDYMYSFIE